MRKYEALILTGFLTGLVASAQSVSFGVTGGLEAAETVRAAANESRPFLVGPTVEFHLPAGFAVEADALYRRVGKTVAFSYWNTVLGERETVSYIARSRGNSWQFPVLGKYYFHGRAALWEPFLGMGCAFRKTWFTDHASTSVASRTGVQITNETAHRETGFDPGATAAAGVRLGRGRLALVPEVRYTRWASQDSTFRQNEAAFLLSARF